MKYIIITPAKNEAGYIKFTIESVIRQTIKPEFWIIANDGSTDETASIVQRYQQENGWIKLVNIDNQQEKRLYGSKVIRAFLYAYEKQDVQNLPHDFIVKLDADLTLPDDYFEKIIQAFRRDPELGICGGYIVEKQGDLEKKMNLPYYIQGAIKSVRNECFADIGGFQPIDGWDGLDQMTARYKGWRVRNISIPVMHHRAETTEYRSLKFYRQNGITHYQLGNDLFLTFIRCIHYLRYKPYVLASVSYLYGFLLGLLTRKRLVDKDLAGFIRKYHYNRIRKLNKNVEGSSDA